MTGLEGRDPGAEHPGPAATGRGEVRAGRGPAPWAVALVLVLWGAVIYGGSLRASFHFDDFPNIVDNDAIRITAPSPQELARAAVESPIRARPVAYISFALNHYSHGDRVLGYHLVNVAVHLLATLGFYAAVLLLLRLPPLAGRWAGRRRWIAAAAAALWLVHPVHVQAVTYIVQRMASMAALFVIASLAALLWGSQGRGWRRWGGLAAAGALFLLGLGSKETAVILPVAAVLGHSLLSSRSHSWPRLGLSMALAVAAGASAVLLVWGPAKAATFLTSRLMSHPEHLLTLPRAFFYHLSLLVLPLPSRLGLIHDLPFSTSLLEPAATLPAVIALLAVSALPLVLARRSPLTALCLFWFLLLFLAEALVVKHNPVFEHRLYLPSMGLALLAGVGLNRLAEARGQVPALAVLTAVVLALSLATVQHNRIWRDEITLWSDAVDNAPGSTLAHSGLISALVRAGRWDEARERYQRLASLPSRYAYDDYFTGKSALLLGRHHEAVQHLSRGLAKDPGHCESRRMLAEGYAGSGRIADALAQLQLFQETCMGAGAIPLARRAQDRAARLVAIAEDSMRARIAGDPRDLEAHFILAGILIGRSDCAAAMEHLRAVLEARPDHAPAWSNLGFCAYEQGEYDSAVAHQERAIALAPGLANAHYGRGQALDRLGRVAEAAESYRRFLALAPPHDAFRLPAQKRLEELAAGPGSGPGA